MLLARELKPTAVRAFLYTGIHVYIFLYLFSIQTILSVKCFRGEPPKTPFSHPTPSPTLDPSSGRGNAFSYNVQRASEAASCSRSCKQCVGVGVYGGGGGLIQCGCAGRVADPEVEEEEAGKRREARRTTATTTATTQYPTTTTTFS